MGKFTLSGLIFTSVLAIIACGDGNPGSACPDIDPGDDFVLWVPENTQACTLNWVVASDLPRAFATKGRVTFRPGEVRLSKEAQTTEHDWIERMEAGPDGTVATATGPGVFTREDTSYLFTQEFDYGLNPASFRLVVDFGRDGPVQCVSERSLADHVFHVSGTFSDNQAGMASCQYSYFDCARRTFRIAGGDTLEVLGCSYCPPQMMCKSDPAALEEARYSGATGERLVTNHFHLVHSMRHHNWGSDYLIRFAEPLGDVHYLYLGSDSYPDYHNFSEIQYLDASLGVVQTKAVVDQ